MTKQVKWKGKLKEGWPPDPNSFAQSVQHGIPNVSLDICPHIFVEASAGSAVVVPYFEGFPYSHVVGQSAFVLALHVVDGVEIIYVELVLAVLVVLTDA